MSIRYTPVVDISESQHHSLQMSPEDIDVYITTQRTFHYVFLDPFGRHWCYMQRVKLKKKK